jgi:hypothetical protein
VHYPFGHLSRQTATIPPPQFQHAIVVGVTTATNTASIFTAPSTPSPTIAANTLLNAAVHITATAAYCHFYPATDSPTPRLPLGIFSFRPFGRHDASRVGMNYKNTNATIVYTIVIIPSTAAAVFLQNITTTTAS